MSVIKYAVRHKATGKFMPDSSTGKGWSFWNPDSPTGGMEIAVKDSIRLFNSSKGADNARVTWARGEAHHKETGIGTLDYEERLEYKDVGRKKDMLEVVPMTLSEMQPSLFAVQTSRGVLEQRNGPPPQSSPAKHKDDTKRRER